MLTDGAVRQFRGREFQSLGAATEKRQAAVSKLCGGTDRNFTAPTDDREITSRQDCDNDVSSETNQKAPSICPLLHIAYSSGLAVLYLSYPK